MEENKNIDNVVDTVVEKKEKKKFPLWAKILSGFGGTIGGIVVLFLLLILVLNVAKFGIYNDYYSMREVICTNHGMNDNYVSQGTAVTDDGKYLLTSGYMSDKTHSRVYLTEIATDETKFIKLEKNGKVFKGHAGGVAVTGNTIFVASESFVYTLDLQNALKEETEIVAISEGFAVENNDASFIFSDKTHVYVGEFIDGEDSENIVYNNVTYNAIVEKYEIGNYTTPVACYAIPDKIQGFAIDDRGGIMLSSSYGLTTSHFYYYKEVVSTDLKRNGVSIYVCETPTYIVNGPAMSEDLDYYDGKFYTNYESSCNKYIWGKLFIGTDYVVALDVNFLDKKYQKPTSN